MAAASSPFAPPNCSRSMFPNRGSGSSTRTVNINFFTWWNITSPPDGGPGERWPRGGRGRGSNDLADLVLDDRLDDVPAVLLAADQGLGEAEGLPGGGGPRHRRLVRVDHALDQGRAVRAERLPDHPLGVPGLVEGEAGDADGLGVLGEVDRVEVAPVLRVRLHDHLLPPDLPE